MMISYLKDIKCPEYIILNTTNELNTFIDSVQKYINKDDIIELITQVFEKILNNEENITFNYNRLINNNIEIYKILDIATSTLSSQIVNQIKKLRADQNNVFPYYFYRLIGSDIIVKSFPY